MMRRVDDELAGHADRFRGLVEVCNDLMQCVDARGIVEYVNPAWLRTLGRAEAEVVGRPITEFLHADAIAHCREVLADVFAGRPRHGVEVAFCGADGSKVVVEGDVLPRQVDGEVVATQAFFRDVTRQRAIAADRTAKMAFLDQVVESAPEALVFLANDGRVTRVNPEFTRLFGYTDAEARGWPIDELVVPEAMRAEGADLCRRAAAAETVNIETVRQRKDGALVEVSLLATPIRAGGEQLAILGIYRDVSERRRLQARLERAQRMEAVGRLAGGIAHDFNNMSTSILGHGDLIRAETLHGTPARSYVEELLRTVEQAAERTRQLLGFARPQLGGRERVDLAAFVVELMPSFTRVCEPKHTLRVHGPTSVQPVFANRAQLQLLLRGRAEAAG